MTISIVRPTALLVGALLFSGLGAAGQKSLLHCFYFTPIAEATVAEWDAFYEATDALPDKIDGLERIWVGNLTERAAVAQQVKLGRTHGTCMEFTDQAALKSYATHPAHDEWLRTYENVRVPGTTTFDILGQ
jgi:hypothetical protein